METETKELTVLDEFKILEVYKYDVIEKAAEAIEAEVMSEVCDVSTSKGRNREKALAYKVSQSMSRVVKMANSSIEGARATVKAVTSERLRLEARFKGIRDKRKAESIAWEAHNQARIDGHKAAIKGIQDFIYKERDEHGGYVHSSIVEAYINEVSAIGIGSAWQEFEAEAELMKKEVLDALTCSFDQAKQREADAAELKLLKEQAAKRDAEDAIRKAKEKADKAEALAKEQERKDAIAAKEKAEADAKAAQEAEKQRKMDEAVNIEQAKIAAKEEERERLEKIQAEKDSEAKRIEDRAAHERLVKHNAELKRQADKDHRQSVEIEIADAMLDYVSDDGARDLINAIIAGKIPHVSIQF